ncbi:hypothetical protein CASFOL_022048 [Castilleja foliolosa]|uniref:F-box domain-containing protein n=2 Tax=Castilleja foliolosa TaxID=1961234 RepID=A0ABD3CZM3_9LAMI
MNRQSARRESEDDNGSAITTDRLSRFPQPVLHNLLSLLPQKDAVRTSVLSKSWRYLWYGRLNLEFRDDDYRFARRNQFWSFLDKTLQRYIDQNLSLQKFLVDICHYEVDFVLLQKWIPVLIINMGISSFTLISYCTKLFPLPLLVFQSESLVELHLKRCDLNTLKSIDNVMLNNLQTLRLHSVDITDEIFEKIISSCPLIENLDLVMCNGLYSIKLHKHHKIKSFCCFVNDSGIINIEDPHPLESVRIHNCRNWFFHHKNMHFPHLKSLQLYSVRLSAKTFDKFSSFFPCVSELILHSCDDFKELHLLSSSIKRLTIRTQTNLKNRIKAFIDTPNILYFQYSGHGFLPSIKFTTTSNEWASHISVGYKLKRSDNDATLWFLKLNNLLKALSQSHITLNLNLSHGMCQKLHINDSYGGFYKPVVVKEFKLLQCLSPPSDPPIFKCFFRICRPRYIHIEESSSNELVKFMCNLIPKEKGSYSWLQDLEEVSIELREKIEDEWHWVQSTSLPEPPNRPPIRFQLTWRE